MADLEGHQLGDDVAGRERDRPAGVRPEPLADSAALEIEAQAVAVVSRGELTVDVHHPAGDLPPAANLANRHPRVAELDLGYSQLAVRQSLRAVLARGGGAAAQQAVHLPLPRVAVLRQ